ncbi:Peroxidase [Rhynchospora pubera]|uniref:peroxidase n=1 Tax=Rhynchospora pubera TaxID=906938 RepID=A0AAV8FQI1_9POAL|nr:Peroxidase [Rhynchospora pubera]KAJ4816972.1 Peroxidase [Rhynchospora pubera]
MSSEKDAAPNMNSLRGFEVIDDIKSQLESVCPQTVSCADILTVAARDSVVALGGANWTVFLGRRDSLTANQNAANSDLPSPDSDLSTLISAFANKGLSTTDMIALSGAHTIGLSRCSVFQNSISSDTSTNIDSSFAASLLANCSNGVNNSTAPLDTTTPIVFDIKYYNNLMEYKGLLHSDRVLYNNGLADSQVGIYAQNPYQFFTDFITGMIKMGNISTLTGSDGEIRVNCRKTN